MPKSIHVNRQNNFMMKTLVQKCINFQTLGLGVAKGGSTLIAIYHTWEVGGAIHVYP